MRKLGPFFAALFLVASCGGRQTGEGNNLNQNNLNLNLNLNLNQNNQNLNTSLCGNGAVEADEVCDGADLRDTTCADLGYNVGVLLCTANCAFDTTGCGTCGDGVIQGGETCDDHNSTAGDGCGAACEVESGWQCTGEPSVCDGICGDELIVGVEVCDGSNLGGVAHCDDLGPGYLGQPTCDATCHGYVGCCPDDVWLFQTVDGRSGITSLALDDAGHPHIAYYTLSFFGLKYAFWDGATWQNQTVDSSGVVGVEQSLALDSAGRPHISYLDWDNLDVKYAHWTGSAWQIQVLETQGDAGWSSSLVLDAADRPHISYYDVGVTALLYTHWDGNAWQTQTVDHQGDVGPKSSLVLDSTGYPHIAYDDLSVSRLRYAHWDGNAWQIQTVATASATGYTLCPSLRLDNADRPHISFADPMNGVLRYAYWDGSAWQSQIVDSVGQVASTSLALESNGSPHIAYYTDTGVKYTYWDGSAWQIQLMDSQSNILAGASLQLDSFDLPRISYSDSPGPGASLRYARLDCP